MNIQFSKVNSLDEVDFDVLFDGSYPDILENLGDERNMPYEELKQYFRTAINKSLEGEYNITAFQRGDTMFMYRYEIDSVNRCLVVGLLDPSGTTFKPLWYFVAPDANGSKADVFKAETQEARRIFFDSLGITHYTVSTLKTSRIASFLRERHNRGDIEIVEEYPTYDLPEDSPLYAISSNYITFKIKN